MKKFVIDVTRRLTVELDPEKLNPLMEEFNASITDFGTGEDALEEHARHIARLVAAVGFDFHPKDFVEGYGVVGEAGIQVTNHLKETDVEIVSGGAGT